MKPVKLLTLTTRNYLGIFTVLTLFFFGVFYLITKREVERSTDEILFNRRAHIQAWFRKQGVRFLPQTLPSTDSF